MILMEDNAHPGLGEKVFVRDIHYLIGLHFDVLEVFSPGKRAKVTRYDMFWYMLIHRLLDEKDVDRIMDKGFYIILSLMF